MTVVKSRDWTATDGEHSSINDVTNMFRRNRRNCALAPQVISTLLKGANKTFKGTVCPAPAPSSRVSMDFASVGGFRDVASSLSQDEVSPAAAVFLSEVKRYSVNTVSALGHAREIFGDGPTSWADSWAADPTASDVSLACPHNRRHPVITRFARSADFDRGCLGASLQVPLDLHRLGYGLRGCS
jgi:hypothetical protein